MLFQGHLLLGLLVYIVASPYFNQGNELLFFFFVMLGSLLPDIDEEKSTINKWSGIVGRIVGKIFPHRGFLHSLLFFMILFFLIDYFWLRPYGVALLLGYVAHIMGDGISLQGVRIFYPLPWKIKGFMKVGGWFEGVLTVLLFVLIVKLIVF